MDIFEGFPLDAAFKMFFYVAACTVDSVFHRRLLISMLPCIALSRFGESTVCLITDGFNYSEKCCRCLVDFVFFLSRVEGARAKGPRYLSPFPASQMNYSFFSGSKSNNHELTNQKYTSGSKCGILSLSVWFCLLFSPKAGGSCC